MWGELELIASTGNPYGYLLRSECHTVISHSWRDHRPHRYTDWVFVVVVVVVVAVVVVRFMRCKITVSSASLCNQQ